MRVCVFIYRLRLHFTTGCRRNKGTYKIHGQKPAEIPPHILRTRLLKIGIRSVDLDLPSASVIIYKQRNLSV